MLDLIYSNKAELSSNLKQLRTINEKTLEFVSSKTGLSVSFLSQMEQGKRGIKPIDFYKILCAYNLSFIDYLKLCNKEQNNTQFAKAQNDILLLQDDKKEEFTLSLKSNLANEILKLTFYNTSHIDFLAPSRTAGSIYCLENELIVNLNKEEYLLKPNDILSFKMNDSIEYRNHTNQKTEALIICQEAKF